MAKTSMNGKSILTSHLHVDDNHYSSYYFSHKCEYCGKNADVCRRDEYGVFVPMCMDCGMERNLINPSDEILEVIHDTMEDSVIEFANRDKNTYDRRFICDKCHHPITKGIHIFVEYDEDLEESLEDDDYNDDGTEIEKVLNGTSSTDNVLCDKCFYQKYQERE